MIKKEAGVAMAVCLKQLPIKRSSAKNSRLTAQMLQNWWGCHFHAAIGIERQRNPWQQPLCPAFLDLQDLSHMNSFVSHLSAKHFLPALALAAGSMTVNTAWAQAPQPQTWVKICSKINETDICNVKYDVITKTGQLVTGVNLLQSKGKTNRRIFQIAVPAGRYIPEGIKVQIDSGKVNTLPYSLCMPDRCLAEIQLSEGLVKALKGGGGLTLTSTNFRAQKNPIKVSLKGFTAAFDGPPLKRKEVENRQKKLQEELQRKAKETADKLKAAQEAAKSGN